jgi:hypothetical protein
LSVSLSFISALSLLLIIFSETKYHVTFLTPKKSLLSDPFLIGFVPRTLSTKSLRLSRPDARGRDAQPAHNGVAGNGRAPTIFEKVIGSCVA